MSEWKDMTEAKLLKLAASTEALIAKKEEQLVLMEDLLDGARQELAKRGVVLSEKAKTIIGAIRFLRSPPPLSYRPRNYEESRTVQKFQNAQSDAKYWLFSYGHRR